MKKPLLAILKNESDQDYNNWVTSCEKIKETIDFDVIDLTKFDWLDNVMSKEYDLFITLPPGLSSNFKQLYDERIIIISQYLHKKIYPTLTEILIYENKRNLSYWLNANKILSPKTWIFYYKNEALNFIQNAHYPIVAKLNIGASGNGVTFLNDTNEADKYIKRAFSASGLNFKTGPKLSKGNLLKKIQKVLFRKGFLSNRLREYKTLSIENQKGFVLFQEFIKHDFEWRCVRIGDAFFAHKKLAVKGKASGTLEKAYDNPPIELFDYINDLTNKYNLKSVAIDLFENNNNYLINEIQCIFGQSDPYQMLVDGKPGKYVIKIGKWHFEEGMFNTNKSYDLRLEHALTQLNIK